MDLWFAQYLVCDGEKHLQGTQVKDYKDRNCYCQLLLSIIIIIITTIIIIIKYC